jgi:cell division protein FtsI (penicillin-binding protein 3)
VAAGKANVQDSQRAHATARRLRAGLAIVMVLLVILGARLFQLQGLDTAGMAQAAVDKRLRTSEIPALRGEILDANNTVLARSVQRFDIVVDQRLVEDFERFNPKTKRLEQVKIDGEIKKLAGILGQDVETVTKAVVGDLPFNYVAKSVTPDIQEKVENLAFPGLQSRETTTRSYPMGQVAGSIVGFLGSDGSPLEGIEATQQDLLAGTSGERTFEIGADGIRIPVATNEETPAEDGQSVRLTLNSDLQWYAQEAIAAQVRSTARSTAPSWP